MLITSLPTLSRTHTLFSSSLFFFFLLFAFFLLPSSFFFFLLFLSSSFSVIFFCRSADEQKATGGKIDKFFGVQRKTLSNRSGATLIVCPMSLLAQWRDEVLKHTTVAPDEVFNS